MLKTLVFVADVVGVIALVYCCVKKCKHVSDEDRVDSESIESVDDIELAEGRQKRKITKDYQNDIYSIYVPSVPQELVNMDISPDVQEKSH